MAAGNREKTAGRRIGWIDLQLISVSLVLACVVVADLKRVVFDVHSLRVVGRRLGLRVLLR